jgi:pimeloyl-ACP methyl ester carboxylesterase
MASRGGAARLFFFAAVTGLIAVLAGRAQPTPKDKDMPKGPVDPNRFQVPINTADNVELAGTYYRGNKGRDTPCVIIVHKLGSDRTKSGLDDLARTLNAEGFAVLTFDLRGHGQSTNVSPGFWNVPQNKNGIIGGSAKQTTITSSKFKPAYLPWLANDVAAARRFFEIKNDAGEVNAQSIFVVGCDEGAALGFTFMAGEWYREYRVGVKALQSAGTSKIAGDDLAGAVWLGLTTRPNNIFLPMVNWVRNTPNMRDKNPMDFIYFERDTKAKADAEDIMKALAMNVSGREKLHKLDAKLELKGNPLSGQALLGPAAEQFGAREAVVKYIKKVMADRKAIPWENFEAASNPLTLVNLRALSVSVP